MIEFSQNLIAIEYECILDNSSRTRNRKKNLNTLKSAIRNAGGDSSAPRFELFLQPKFLCKRNGANISCRLIGAEELIRLRHPDIGLMMPDDFFSLAKNSGLTKAIDFWVRDSIVLLACELKESYNLPSDFDLSINVEPEQIASDDFTSELSTIIRQHALDNLISIEILENWALDKRESRNVNDRLGDLSRHTRIFIDDFGTGTTKIDYLAHIEGLSGIKIDMALIRKIGTKRQDRIVSLIGGIANLASTHRIDVIAEGVEHDEQLNVLLDLGINKFQGFHEKLGRPMPIEDFKKKLLSRFKKV